jgi:hypothetical protein
MAYAKATLKNTIRAMVDDEPAVDAVANAAGTGTTVTVADGTQYAAGDILEHVTNGDQALVRSVSGNDLTVRRSHNGTTATSWSNGDLFYKNPEYADIEIDEAIQATVDDLWPFVYAVKTTTITPATPNPRIYEMPAAFMDFIAGVQDNTVGSVKKVYQYGVRGSLLPVGVRFNLPSAVASTGKALELPIVHVNGNTILVTYAALVTTTLSGSDYADFESGAFASMMAHGAVAWLLESKEIERVADDVDQGDTGVAPAARVRDAAYFRQRYEQLRRQVNLKLNVASPRAGRW